MRLTVNITDGTADHIETARKLEAADQALRQSFSGFELDVVVPRVEASLGEVGVDVSGAEVRAYAQAISSREDHELTLR